MVSLGTLTLLAFNFIFSPDLRRKSSNIWYLQITWDVRRTWKLLNRPLSFLPQGLFFFFWTYCFSNFPPHGFWIKLWATLIFSLQHKNGFYASTWELDTSVSKKKQNFFLIFEDTSVTVLPCLWPHWSLASKPVIHQGEKVIEFALWLGIYGM